MTWVCKAAKKGQETLLEYLYLQSLEYFISLLFALVSAGFLNASCLSFFKSPCIRPHLKRAFPGGFMPFNARRQARGYVDWQACKDPQTGRAL